jgi:hypothetical protein
LIPDCTVHPRLRPRRGGRGRGLGLLPGRGFSRVRLLFSGGVLTACTVLEGTVLEDTVLEGTVLEATSVEGAAVEGIYCTGTVRYCWSCNRVAHGSRTAHFSSHHVESDRRQLMQGYGYLTLLPVGTL